MKTNAEWKRSERELKALLEKRDKLNDEIAQKKAERNELSAEIHRRSMAIKQHKKAMDNLHCRTNTIVYLMFGKKIKDLTKEEYRIYYNARQRIRRVERKTNPT